MNKAILTSQKAIPQSTELIEASIETLNEQGNEKLRVYRVVVGFLLASLLWKCRAVPMFYLTYTSLPLRDPFFPALMQDPKFLAAAFLLPVVLGIVVLVSSDRRLILAQSATTFFAMWVLCTHQGTYNDATFVTCLWTSAWCWWYALRMGDPTRELLAKARTFSALIVSMIFLGGAMGKWTPGYWSGEVLYQIYFVDRDFWLFNLLRSNLSSEQLREFATYYSRLVVMTESASACLWLLPAKLACAIAISVLLGIALFSNLNLFSVMFCLFGLCIVGLHEPKPKLG